MQTAALGPGGAAIVVSPPPEKDDEDKLGPGIMDNVNALDVRKDDGFISTSTNDDCWLFCGISF